MDDGFFSSEVQARRGEAERTKFLQDRELRIEAKMVNQILRFYGLSFRKVDAFQQCEELTGRRQLSFRWLSWVMTQDSPCRLTSRFIPNIQRTRLHELMQAKWKSDRWEISFFRSKVFRAFEEERAAVSTQPWTALLVPWNGIPSMALHDEANTLPGPCALVFQHPDGRRFLFEPLETFLRLLERSWQPALRPELQ